MRIGWIGVHAEGIPALEAVCAAEHDVVGMLTLRQSKADKRCGSGCYAAICEQHDVPLFEIDHVNDPEVVAELRSWNCDLLVVLGWGQILNAQVLSAARIGAVGAHASLLPHNRGSAPVNWAIIKGEQVTGNSLMWLSEGVDTGELIDQRAFEITPFDTCASIYDKVAESNRDMLLDLCLKLQAGERPGRPQRSTNEDLLPRRRPQDGQIHWNDSTANIYNMIRALARPYPGAFADVGGQRFIIWQAARLPIQQRIAFPGTVLGPVYSPDPAACGQLIATADGAILLTEVEDRSGCILTGHQLSETKWIPERLRNAA